MVVNCAGYIRQNRRDPCVVFPEPVLGHNLMGKGVAPSYACPSSVPIPVRISFNQEGGICVPKARLYSPRLDENLISPLYHAAKAKRIPMTRLASSLVRAGLAALGGSDGGESCVVHEEPPADDPRGRQD